MKKLILKVLVVVFILSGFAISSYADPFIVQGGFGGSDYEVDIVFEEVSTTFSDVSSYVESPKNYKDELLFGNNTFGHKDGSKSNASVGVIWSMVTDNQGDVWFIDQDISYQGMGNWWVNYTGYTIYHETDGPFGIKYKNQFLRKYDSKTGIVTTIKDLNRLRIKYKGKDGKKYILTDYRAYKLVHNPINDKIYLSGKFEKNLGIKTYNGVLFQVSPSFKAVAGDKGFNNMFGADDFALTTPDGSILYSRKDGFSLQVYKISEGGSASKFGEVLGCEYRDTVEAILTDNYLYLLLKNIESIRLMRLNLVTNTWERVEKFVGAYEGIEAHSLKFLASLDGNVYTINLDGSRGILVDINTIALEEGTIKGKVSLMTVQVDGSIVYFDGKYGVVRKLSNTNKIVESYDDIMIGF